MDQTTKTMLKWFNERGLSASAAYREFREAGGKRRKQDFLSDYRQITQKPRASYNVGGAKRSDVKVSKVEKYEKKKERKRAQQAAPKKPSPKKKRSKSHGRETGGGGGKGTSVKKGGVDLSTSFGAGSPDLKTLKTELQRHGIKFFRRDGKDALTLAKDGENGTVNLYGTMIYDPSRDKGGRVVGVARTLINKAMKTIGRQMTL